MKISKELFCVVYNRFVYYIKATPTVQATMVNITIAETNVQTIFCLVFLRI